MKRRHGFSRLEMLWAIVVIAVLSSVLLNRLAFYQEAAEKANVEYTIATLRSALRVQMATLLASGRMRDYPMLEQMNPFDWLEEKPSNYRLVTTGAPPEPGYWHFNRETRILTYWVVRGSHFQADSTGEKRIRMKIELVRNAVAADPAEQKLVLGVRMVLIEPYKWLE